MTRDRTTEDASTGDVTLDMAADLRAWRTRALDVLLGVVIIAGALAVGFFIGQTIRTPGHWFMPAILVVIYLLGIGLLAFRRLSTRLRTWSTLILGYVAAMLAFARGGLAGDGPLYLLALPTLALILLGTRYGALMAAFSLLTFAAFAVAAHLGWLANWLVIRNNPLDLMSWASKGTGFTMLLTGMTTLQWLLSRSQTRALRTSREREAELRKARALLEEHVEEAERRARRFEALAHVSQETTSLLEPEEMLQRVAGSIREEFDFEAVAIYLVDEHSLRSIEEIRGGLRAFAGASAEVATHHAMMHGVRRVIRSGEPQPIQSDAAKEAPTCGELVESTPVRFAVPLQTHNKVIGALAVQAEREAAFSDENIAILQMMANQIAVAIENARLFSQTQSSLEELNQLHQAMTGEAWRRFAEFSSDMLHYRTESSEVPQEAWDSLFDQARSHGRPTTGLAEGQNETWHLLVVPVQLRATTIGMLGFHRPLEGGTWQPEEIAMAEDVAERTALAMEDARLLEEAQRRVTRERMVGEIARRLRASLNPDTILRATVRELGRALGAEVASVEVMGPMESNDASDGKET